MGARQQIADSRRQSSKLGGVGWSSVGGGTTRQQSRAKECESHLRRTGIIGFPAGEPPPPDLVPG